MKVLCFADLHIGQKGYCKIEPESGLYLREINAINILNQIIDDAIQQQVDAVVFAGDMFKNNLPNPTLINKVNQAFLKLSQNKIYTFILDGNHDVSKIETFSSGLHQFQTLEIPYIIQTRFYQEHVIEIDNVKYQFVLLPTHHNKQEIEDYLNKLNTIYPTIIIGHLAIKNAKLNDWNIINNDDCIDLEIFNKQNILAVVLGHFHKYQVLNDKPLVFYCGSADRIDFSEEKQEKGYVVLNIDNNVEYNFIPMNMAQKFLTLNIDCSDETDANSIEEKIIKKIPKTKIKNTILKIKLKLNNEVKINEKKIQEYMYKHKALFLLKIIYEIENVETEDIEITNNITSFEAVEKYYQNQPRSQERIQLCKEIIERVDSSV